MKPYRGTLLVSAALLATLSLSGCGDADNWEKTTEIRLSAPEPKGLNEVVFTVVSPPPAEGYACETILQYRAEGTGVNIQWANIPGTETTRLFSVRPRGEGVLSVVARGMCAGSKEDWKYSNQVDVTVTAVPGTTPVVPVLPTVTSVTVAANPTTVVEDNPVTFTLGATKPVNCTLALRYQYTGAGYGITTVNPAAPGLFQLTPTVPGTLVVTATGWCTENPAAQVTGSATVTVTNAVLPTVTSVTLTGTTAYSLLSGGGVIFSLSGSAPAGCTLRLRFQASGAGATAVDIVPATAGSQAAVTPTLLGTLTGVGSGWCMENPTAVLTSTVNVTVGP